MNTIRKYPRTPHLEGSRIQIGDEDLKIVPFSHIQGRECVIEEKMDGANSAVSIGQNGTLLLQSRGHYLTGGPREKHYDLFKTWANRYAYELQELLGTRYIMYGEWMYAKHTVFYTDLPHYFLEFDIFDKETGKFLGTDKRRSLLHAFPFIHSVKVLARKTPESIAQLQKLIGKSTFINNHITVLKETCRTLGLPEETILRETDMSDLMEGLYIKVEHDGYVIDRVKLVRSSFLTTVQQSEAHWLNRPIVPNILAEGVNIFGE
jgi:ATP-dependent RNA circularization protein (DNA/RNA ligase family)